MPSNVSKMIARRMLHEHFDFGNTVVNANAEAAAEFLDAMGVGDAFAVCDILKNPCWVDGYIAEKTAKEAMRKAGVV